MSEPFRACAVVPTYDNPLTVRRTVERLREHSLPVVLVDDGSHDAGRRACEAIAAGGLATVERLERNAGKGAAVKTGFRAARDRGFTHAFQVDADGQHDLERVPEFLDAARRRPEALVLAYPVYDSTVPLARRVARGLTAFWVAVEVGGRRRIQDAMIGFRVYPLAAAAALPPIGDRMDFDIEIAVRLVRAGVPTVNLPVGVRYLSPEAGGVSHFRMVRDNLTFARLHTRLCIEGAVGWARRGRRARG